jgi:hypothetical protein
MSLWHDPDAADTTTATVISLEDGIATVLVGEEGEEWAFPAHLLPSDCSNQSVIVLTGEGRDLRVLGLAEQAHDGSVECRLNRGLNRRRFASLG